MTFLYTTCFSRVAESLMNGTFSSEGYVEMYKDIEYALKMAHPGDEWVITLRVSKDEVLQSQVNCTSEFLNAHLYSLFKLDAFREVLGVTTTKPEGKCATCVNPDKSCDSCKDNPKFSDYPHRSYYMRYVPVCPQGYKDCVCDPAYIKCYHPKWYAKMYGNKLPEEVINESCNPEDEYCYDDEDK